MSLVIDRVRERYPEYDNLSDSDLTLSLGQKFPQYLAADPAFKNEFDQASIGAVEHGLGVAMEAGVQVAKTIPLIRDAVSQPTPEEQDIAKVQDIVSRRENEQATAEARSAVGNPLSFIVSSVKSRILDEPLFKLVQPMDEATTPEFVKKSPTLLGIRQSVEENINQLTTPKNLGLLAAGIGVGSIGPVAARAVSIGFAAMMAKQVPDIAAQLGEEYAKPESERDQTKIAKLISDGAIATGFTALAGVHGVGEPIQKAIGSVPTLTPSPVLRNLAPLTAKALEEVPQTPKVNVELPKETPAIGIEPVAEPGPITPLVEAKGPLTGEEIPSATPEPQTAVTPIGEQNAVQIQSPNAEVLRQPQSEVGLQGVGEGNIKPEEAAGAQGQAPISQRPLADAWEKYDGTGEISTVGELADHIEGLIVEGKAPESLQSSVDKYRDAVEEDFKMAGRGDLENDEARFLKSVRKAVTQESKSQKAKSVQAPIGQGELAPEFDPKKKVQVTARGPDGEDIAVTMKAKEAVDRITKRKSALQALLDCLGGT